MAKVIATVLMAMSMYELVHDPRAHREIEIHHETIRIVARCMSSGSGGKP